MGNDEHNVSRRGFLQRLSAMGVASVGGGALLSACGGGSDQEGGGQAQQAGGQTAAEDDFACDDLSALTDAQQQQREQMVGALNYVDETPNEDQYCANCSLYVQPEQEESTGEQCGGCQLFPGPVHPNGYCTSWAPA